MLDVNILEPEVRVFLDNITYMLIGDFIGACTDNHINCDGSSLNDSFMAVINQRYVIEMLCIDTITIGGEVLTDREGVERYELTIGDRGGEVCNFSDVENPPFLSTDNSCLSIYFYGYKNSILVLQELMTLYNVDGV